MAIPNAFTPNGDSLNDVFRIIHSSNVVLRYLKTLKHYGEEVFSTSDFSKGWDGMYSGNKQPEGAYIYILSADKNDYSIQKQDSLLLIR